jgi:hypothetical protein
VVNIGVGPGGSERVVINGLTAVDFSGSLRTWHYLFPLNIPAGTSVSVQATGDHAFNEGGIYVSINLYDSGMAGVEGCAGVDAVGLTAGHGTAYTPGAGAKGFYSQIVASTARDYMGFYVAVDLAGGTSFQVVTQLVDIAIGSAGSELIIVPDITWAQGGSSWTGRSAVAGPYFIPIPAGTRIAARGASPAGSPFDVGVILTAMYQ